MKNLLRFLYYKFVGHNEPDSAINRMRALGIK